MNCEFCQRAIKIALIDPRRCDPCQKAWLLVKANEFTLQRMLDAAQRNTIQDILANARNAHSD